MRTLIALALGVLLVAALTSGACCNKCNSCAKTCCNKCNTCNKCSSCNACCAKKPACSAAEMTPYKCPCVPVCCICVRVGTCGCASGPLKVTFTTNTEKELGTFELSSCGEGCFTFPGDVNASDIKEAWFTAGSDQPVTIENVKIWLNLNCDENKKPTLANFKLMDGVTVGGADGCSSFFVF
jgi:hypothetical protein